MSTHSNQAKSAGPTSSRTGIRGHNPTYLASVQREAGKKSSTKPAGSNKRQKDSSVDGAHRTTSVTALKGDTVTGSNVKGGYGDGHYVKA